MLIMPLSGAADLQLGDQCGALEGRLGVLSALFELWKRPMGFMLCLRET